MRSALVRVLVIGVVCGVALSIGVLGRIAAADDAGQEAVQADHALLSALAKSDKAAVGKLLDADFVWTDGDGKSMKKAEVLDGLAAYATDNQGEDDVQTHFYTLLETVLGSHHGARFLRVWVKRPAGWREFLELDTPISTQNGQRGGIETGAGQGDCENPCRTLPYTPKTAMDKAIVADWQKTKVEEWHPDAVDWPMHIADEFLIINNNGMRNKAERVAIAQKAQAAGAGTPGDPITAMEIYDFGDNAAVMISHHVPHRGGKPYYNVRVWTLRDGRWQLAVSQQSTIQAAAAVPATTK
jgi:ketosteroid isomerase-like protein